ncbi:MAG: isoprenylcysteine carboxylmethyltransferase family protein [Planctomycetota bacterium]
MTAESNKDYSKAGPQTGEATKKPPSAFLAWFVGLLYTGLVMAVPFCAARRLDWVEGWVFLVLIVAGAISSHVFVKARNPEVLKHRKRIGKGTKSWDRIWLGLFRLMLIGMLVVAGFDAERFGWTSMPWWLCPIGVVLVSLGFALSARSMAENPHFEGTVRIQHDRGHRVIDTGPYSIVRHPGYVGISILALGSPLVLRSMWALVAAVATVLWIVLRTYLEDRLLQAGLDGYMEYAKRVRSRLIPGVW